MQQPAITTSPVASLYVGDLKPDVQEPTLYTFFSRCGSVASVHVCRDSLTQRSLGYAYVNFHNAEEAEKALESLNYSPINGTPCRIMWSQKDPTFRRSGVGNLYVSNLAKGVDSKLLHETFSAFGDISSCKVMTDNKTGESRGFGFVQFEKQEQADAAIAQGNGRVILEQAISVVPARYERKQRDPNEAEKNFTNLFIKNIDPSIDDAKLNEVFSRFGKIVSCIVQKDDKGVSRGFGFCNFETHDSAVKAAQDLDGTLIPPSEIPLVVTRHQKKRERLMLLKQQYDTYAQCNLYVKNLDDSFDDEKLRNTFAQFGTIVSARLAKDANGRSRGFGYVCFQVPEDAAKAINQLRGSVVGQKKLVVCLHQRKEERRAYLEQYANYRMRPMGGMMYPGYFPGYGYPPNFQTPRGFMPPFMPPQSRGYAPQNRGYAQQQYYQQRQRTPGMPYQQYQYVPGAVVQQGMPQAGGRGGRGRGYPQARPVDQKPGPSQAPQVVATPTQQAQTAPVPPQAQPPQTAPQQAADFAPRQLLSLNYDQQKEVIGEYLYPRIESQYGELAGKITGMLLEIDPVELIGLLETSEELNARIQEAYQVLHDAQTEGDKAAEQQ